MTKTELRELLPSVYRIRDARIAEESGLDRGPLQELIAVFAREVAVMGESLDQLYDDLFIETCADWVVPYIGDLIGYESLHPVPGIESERAEVAHTIALRRRKGTALVLEQLARDVTGWDAKAVEYFQRLLWTQYMNHVRPQAVAAPDMRQGLALEWIGTAFETANRTIDVRRISDGVGRHNIPNVGVHLWTNEARPNRQTPATRAGDRRYRVSPLGHDVPLYNRPVAEDDISHPAEPANVPLPLTRKRLIAELDQHYGERPTAGADIDNPLPAIIIAVDGTVIERDQVRVCHLGDDGASWAHTPPPAGVVAIDPVLGRVALPPDMPDPADVRLDWHEGALLDIGGGEYERGDTMPPTATVPVEVPGDHASVSDAIAALGGSGIVEITDSNRYADALAIDIDANDSIEIRASNGRRPVLDLSAFTVTGGAGSAFRMNGVVIAGAALESPATLGNALEHIELRHTTLVPGLSLTGEGLPTTPGAPSIIVEISGTNIEIDQSIIGGIRGNRNVTVQVTDSIVDATSPDEVALSAIDGEDVGPVLSAERATLFGKLHGFAFERISNTILYAALQDADTWPVAVRARNTQTGCVRFSWTPPGSILPRRFRTLPEADGPWVAPHFTSRQYGTAAFAQLATFTPRPVRTAAETGGEIGVTAQLFRTERESNIEIRLEKYLRASLQAGVFIET